MIGRRNNNNKNDDAPPFNFQVRYVNLFMLIFQSQWLHLYHDRAFRPRSIIGVLVYSVS